jgi:hypothetical protein
MDGLISLGFLSMLAMIGAFLVGAQPEIKVAALDANQCQHVQITRFWGTVTMIDAVMCDGQKFTLNGEAITQHEQE